MQKMLVVWYQDENLKAVKEVKFYNENDDKNIIDREINYAVKHPRYIGYHLYDLKLTQWHIK